MAFDKIFHLLPNGSTGESLTINANFFQTKEETSQITNQVTGQIGWRREGDQIPKERALPWRAGERQPTHVSSR